MISVDKLPEIYSYFSHNIRTCNSIIVATVEGLRSGLFDIDSDDTRSIYESAYLLDLFDCSMNIFINFFINNEIKSGKDTVSSVTIVEKVIEEMKSFISLNELNIDVEFNDFNLYGDSFVIKNLLQIVVYEAVKNAQENLCIIINNGEIMLSMDGHRDVYPKIFEMFALIFAENGINFKYTENCYFLEQRR